MLFYKHTYTRHRDKNTACLRGRNDGRRERKRERAREREREERVRRVGQGYKETTCLSRNVTAQF